MRIRTLRALAATAACAVAATALAACGSSGPNRGDGDSLSVWVYQDGSTVIQEEFVEKFNETSDIKLDLVQIPGDNYTDRMRTAMGSPNAPDIFFNWGGGSISDFVAEDMLIDLTPILDEDPEFKDAFIPSILDSGSVDGRYYGIPMRGVQPVILFYNKTAFAEAGVEPPATWDDLLHVIDVFIDRDTVPAVVAGADPWTELMWLEYLLDRRGGAEIFERIRNGDATGWDDPAVQWMAEAVKELVDAGTFGNNFRSVNYTADGASTFFAQGGGVMHLMGSWEYANQLSQQPEFAAEDLGFATFPTVPDGTGDPRSVVGNPTNYWSVSSSVEGERLDAALEFLRMSASDEYAQALIDNGDIPTTSGAESLLDSHANPEFARFQYDMVAEAPSFTLSWDQALPAGDAPALHDNIEKLFGGQISPDAFVAAMRDL
ncbi:Multiple sugar-binding protein [Streptomyces sp. enrichment culture]|uniref:extracellular solute-binding protein n=1 Tax=Streptomyces sp. enrichment culture TaxID=1795815 RepID=UPI003F544F32